jgi:hypothetical protein
VTAKDLKKRLEQKNVEHRELQAKVASLEGKEIEVHDLQAKLASLEAQQRQHKTNDEDKESGARKRSQECDAQDPGAKRRKTNDQDKQSDLTLPGAADGVQKHGSKGEDTAPDRDQVDESNANANPNSNGTRSAVGREMSQPSPDTEAEVVVAAEEKHSISNAALATVAANTTVASPIKSSQTDEGPGAASTAVQDTRGINTRMDELDFDREELSQDHEESVVKTSTANKQSLLASGGIEDEKVDVVDDLR